MYLFEFGFATSAKYRKGYDWLVSNMQMLPLVSAGKLDRFKFDLLMSTQARMNKASPNNKAIIRQQTSVDLRGASA